MALTVLTAPPTQLLTTLARAKTELGIADTSADSLLGDIITRASSAITRECGRTSFGVGTYQEALKGTGSQTLGLLNVPLLSVGQVLQDTEVVNPADPDQGYTIDDAEAGALYRACGWGQTVALLSWGWESYSSRYILPGGTQALRYTVTYTAGYVLPNDTAPATIPVTGSWVSGGLAGSPGLQQNALLSISAGVPLVGQIIYLDTGAAQEPVALGAVSGPAGGTYTATFITLLPHTLPTALVATTGVPAPLLPGDVEEATLVTVKAWWFARARDSAVTQAKSGQISETYALDASDRALPTVALGMIRNYRRVN